MAMNPLRSLLVLLPVLLLVSTVSACPFCDGGDAGTNKVYETIFGDDFWWNAVCVVMPFGVFFLLTVLLHSGLPWPTSER